MMSTLKLKHAKFQTKTKHYAMKIWMIIFFLGLGITAHSQEVIKDGKAYEVKGKAIFHDGVDITADLLSDEKSAIFKSHKAFIKETKAAEKAQKKAEKAFKNAEKAQKKAEKELKNKEKALEKFNKATRKLEQNQIKYETQKNKGRLSPNDESKWLKKLDGYKRNVEKARRKI